MAKAQRSDLTLAGVLEPHASSPSEFLGRSAAIEGDNSVDGVYAFTVTGLCTSALSITRTGSLWPANFGFVSCRVSSSCRSATSSPQAVRLCAADINCSGTLSVQDIFDFLAAYFAGC